MNGVRRRGLLLVLVGAGAIPPVASTAQPAHQTGDWQGLAGDWHGLIGGWQDTAGAATGLNWTETREGVRADLPADLLFDFDRAAVRPQAQAALAELARGIRERAPRRLRIQGHTDAKGSSGYNRELSKRRADAVLRHLADVEHIEAGIMIASGFGETRPVAPNTKPDGSDDPEGRQRNRRVEVVLEKR